MYIRWPAAQASVVMLSAKGAWPEGRLLQDQGGLALHQSGVVRLEEPAAARFAPRAPVEVGGVEPGPRPQAITTPWVH